MLRWWLSWEYSSVSGCPAEKVNQGQTCLFHCLNRFSFQISDAFKKFGISDSDSAVLIVLVHENEDKCNPEEITAHVEGRQISLEDLPTITDVAKVKKVCKKINNNNCIYVG